MVNKSSSTAHQRLVRAMNRRSKKLVSHGHSHKPSVSLKKKVSTSKDCFFIENADVISISSSGSESESEPKEVSGSMHCGTTASKTKNPDGSCSNLPSDEDDDIIFVVSEDEDGDQLQNTDQVQVEDEERVSDQVQVEDGDQLQNADQVQVQVEDEERVSDQVEDEERVSDQVQVEDENQLQNTDQVQVEDEERVSDLSSSSSSSNESECDDSDDEDFEAEESDGDEEESFDSEDKPKSRRKEPSLGIAYEKIMETLMEEDSDDVIYESDDGEEVSENEFLKHHTHEAVGEEEEDDNEEEENPDNDRDIDELGAAVNNIIISSPKGNTSLDSKRGNENDETHAHEVHNGERAVSDNATDSKGLRKPNKVDVEKKLRAKTNDIGFLTKDQTDDVDGAEEETAGSAGEMDALWAEMNCNMISSQIHNTSSLDSKRGTENGEKHANEVHNGKRGRDGDKTGSEGMKKPKKVDVFNLLVNSIWEEHQTREDAIEDEVVAVEEIADEVPEMSDSEREMAGLWAELNRSLVTSQIGNISALHSNGRNEDEEKQSTLCNHDFLLDEEIGVRCLRCSLVDIEIKDFIPAMDKFAAEPRGWKGSYDVEDINVFGGAKFRASTSNPQETSDHAQGTVWDLVPGAWKSMFAHQRDGFEFIWKNLAGTIKLDELKDTCNSNEVVGCLISHGPGTGKTKLSLTFLKSFLEKFESCKPVIVAPASMLLPWEGEFRKWNIGVPFHNLNSLDFSGKESQPALNMMELNGHQGQNKNLIRMVKIHSWGKQKSVLGISYSLYEKLLGVRLMSGKATANRKKAARCKEWEDMRNILLKVPSLLILDEGHTPRNKRSQIWQVLSKAHAKKRIILSGTPFQNNFEELHNVICLVRPKLARKIPSGLIKSSSRKRSGSKKVVDDADGIEKLKNLISPFVHHKGGILEKNLPGLRKCVVVLNPSDLQKELLVKIKSTRNVFEFEHRESLVAIHPSLLLECGLTKEEKSSIDGDKLQSLKVINPNEGSKMRFLVEFIRLCSAMNEKVLIFSQYIHPLSFIVKQLSALFGWAEDRQVLLMHGKLQQNQRQVLINNFNNPTHESRVLIASTRACSEGINLVGASRVVLLDVVWNPSVVRQAISRAYRLGQKRVVYSYHLITRGATEWDKYCKQDEKERIAEMVFTSASDNMETESGDSHKGRAVWEDDVLDDLARHEKLKGVFEKVIYQHNETNLVESFDQ